MSVYNDSSITFNYFDDVLNKLILIIESNCKYLNLPGNNKLFKNCVYYTECINKVI